MQPALSNCLPAGATSARASSHKLASTRGLPPLPTPHGQYLRSRRGQVTPLGALPPDQLDQLHHLHPFLSSFADHLFFAYERVVLPCHNLNCGDVVHKSTLDPVLRLEQKGINPKGIALLLAAAAYLFATPGVLVGAVDYYILDKFSRLANTVSFGPENFKLGKKLAQGGFGTVYRADLERDGQEAQQVIVKMAKEFGEAEVWMNERLMRAAPKYFAQFITAFDEDKDDMQKPAKPGAKAVVKGDDEETPLWLVWGYEGDYTLWDMIQNKSKSRVGFPYCMEELLLGESLGGPKTAERRQVTIRLVVQQVLEALKACHSTGIVHRDVKPQNVIMSTVDNRAKLIDLGAAADLRVGINYVPSEFLLDPRYAPPQQYIMSTSTPSAPALPVAAMLSPILWRLNSPDRFDMYSVGILLLQMAVPYLRSDNNLVAFRKRLESLDFDMDKWRRWFEKRHPRDAAEGFEVLDLDDGVMWDLCKSLMAYKPSERLSAAAALQHPTFNNFAPGKILNKISGALGRATEAAGGEWMADALGGGMRDQAVTEAQLSDELPQYRELPPSLRYARNTINWWQARQGAMKRAEAKGKKGQRRAAAQAQADAMTSDPSQEESPQPVKRSKPKRLAPNLMPWASKPADSEASLSDEPSEVVDDAPAPAPQKRLRLKPSLPWLKPSNESSHESESEADAEASPVYAAERAPPRKASPLSNIPWLGKLAAGDEDNEVDSAAQSNGVSQQQQQQQQRERRDRERPTLQKLIPWMKTSGTTG